MTLELGIWFRFPPRPVAVPERNNQPRPSQFSCDIRGDVHAWHDDLVSAAGKAERWLGRWRPLSAVLHWLIEGERGEEAYGWGAPGSPLNSFLAGYVAREVGDLDVARDRLSVAAAGYRERLERDRGNRTNEVTPEWEAWVERLAADASTT